MSAPSDVLERPSQASSLSFTQGFLLGQLSVVVFVSFFIKFFIFGELPSRRSSGVNLSTLSPTHKRSISFSPSGVSPSRHPASPSHHRRRRSSSSSASTSSISPQFAHIIRPPLHLTPATILHKTYYDVHAHPPESLDWFNVLVAQALAQFRADACTDGAILESLTAVLNGPHKPAFCDRIAVTEIALGESFPIFSNCRVHPIGEDDDGGGDGMDGGSWNNARGGSKARRLLARMDVDLADALTLGVETTLVLNYPRPNTARLPVALSVSVARFSGTLAISFQPAVRHRHGSVPVSSPTKSPAPQQQQHPYQPNPLSATGTKPSMHREPQTPPLPPRPAHSGAAAAGGTPQPTSRTPTTLSFSFSPHYTLSLSTRSLLGARARLQDVPKIATLVEGRLRTWFEERCVAPRRQEIVVPSLWPRMHNVVVGGDGEGPEVAAEVAAVGVGVGESGEEAGLGIVRDDGTALLGGDLGGREQARLTADALQRQQQQQEQREHEIQKDGLRWRGQHHNSSPFQQEVDAWEGQRMPGSMP